MTRGEAYAPRWFIVQAVPLLYRGPVAGESAAGATRVVVFVQENHTTDNSFRGLAPYGAQVASDWLTAKTATHNQFQTRNLLPYYLYLATMGACFENHCSQVGTNSTPNHLVLVGGQSPTLRNPPSGTTPEWDMPSIFGLAEAHGGAWRAYTGGDGYPVSFYTQLKGSPIHRRHGPVRGRRRAGRRAVWQCVDAVVLGGGWDDTVFLLTYDD